MMESEVVVRRRPDGTAAEVHVYTRDVSERVEDHQALLTSEERYRFLAMNSTDLVMRIDQTGLITFASPSVKTILGYEVRALIDTAVHDLVHRDDRDTSTAWMAGVRQLDDTVPEPFRFRMVRADGTSVWTETTMVAATGPDGAAVSEIQTSTRVVAQQVEAHERLQRSGSGPGCGVEAQAGAGRHPPRGDREPPAPARERRSGLSLIHI